MTIMAPVDGTVVSSIGRGLMVLIGLSRDDQKKDVDFIAKKLLSLRLFEGKEGKRWDSSVVDAGLEILCVSQFTLYGELKGNKLDFRNAMASDQSKERYENFVQQLRDAYQPDRVKNGVFGAMMDVSLVNEGPVTYTLDTNPEKLSASSGEKPLKENA